MRAIVGAWKRTGQKLLAFDRRLGARFVAGADEAGRGSLAGPLVVAGVLLDYGSLREHRVRPLAFPQRLEAVLARSGARSSSMRSSPAPSGSPCASIPPADIDRNGLHKSNLAGLRAMLAGAVAAGGGVSRRRLPARPARAGAHGGRRRRREERRDRGCVDHRQGDARPADAPPRRALSRVRLRAARRLHHARPLGRRPRRGPSAVHRPQLPGALLRAGKSLPRQAPGSAERRAVRWYRLRGWTILGANVWAAR